MACEHGKDAGMEQRDYKLFEWRDQTSFLTVRMGDYSTGELWLLVV